jgi:hypothetical protein
VGDSCRRLRIVVGHNSFALTEIMRVAVCMLQPQRVHGIRTGFVYTLLSKSQGPIKSSFRLGAWQKPDFEAVLMLLETDRLQVGGVSEASRRVSQSEPNSLCTGIF